MGFDAVILAGGSSRRLGGADKAEVVVAGERLLDRALAAVSAADRVVVVGPRRRAPGHVEWIEEDPPNSGPAAALLAGLAGTTADMVVVLAVDMPGVTPAVVDRLIESAGDSDGAHLIDGAGRAQPLAGAYSRKALLEAATAMGHASGAPVGALLEGMELNSVDDPRAARGCDTWADVERAQKEAEK